MEENEGMENTETMGMDGLPSEIARVAGEGAEEPSGEGLPAENRTDGNGSAEVQGFAASAENGAGSTELQRRAEELAVQAELLRRATGCDMMALFQTDEGLRGKVISGEWDFVDAYAAKRKEEKPPQLARGGSVSGIGVNVAGMNEGQFGKLNELLAQGGCVRF